MATASTTTINIVPVQGIFNEDHTLVTLIGPAGTPFNANISPDQSGLNITNSTINSSVIGGTVPAAGTFTNIATTTGTITGSPYNPSDIANKQYVDQVAAGLSVKAPVVCASTVNIATLSGLLTLDGITIVAGDRVLVKNQTASQNNGIYVAAAGAWSRSTDCSTWDQLIGAFCFVSTGSTLADTGWVCTVDKGGTLGTTPVTWVQFAGLAVYTAGTGLTLTGTQFSITNTGVSAAAYGSASSVATFTVNAQGQLTVAASTAIAIAATQVTSGTFASSLLSGVYSGITGLGTLVDLTVTNAIVGSITGNAATATSAGTAGSATTAGFATSAGSVTNSVTFNNAGSGGASGSTYNGSAALTVSYNTVGAPSTSGTGASGTWGISITGNAATVTNGLYSTGSYSNPTWLTSISGSIVSGAVSSATTATNLAGGLAGSLPYQTGAGATSMLALGTSGYVLTAGVSAPGYVAQSTLSVGSATTSGTATNLAGGGAGSVPYQTGSGATAFVAAGTAGYYLTSNGTSAPTWTAAAGGITLSDDTTTAATRYPLFADATSGAASTIYTSSTKYQYNPSTGILTATGFSGSGASLTALSASNISAGTLAVAYGGTGLTSTPANGALDIGNGTGFTRTTLTAGSGITITNASGSITIAASGSGATITDDTSTNATRYLNFTAATSGALSTIYTSSTKATYNPSTGAISSPSLIGTTSVTTPLLQSSASNLAITASTGIVDASGNTGALAMPKGTTAQRPGTPITGSTRYNSSYGSLEYYNGTTWIILTTVTYTSSYLVVAGGGAGPGQGGGGGAGGVLSNASTSLTAGTTYAITVGAGGSNSNGSNSVFSTFATAIGGGRGGDVNSNNASAGGSGGGGGRSSVGTLGGGGGTSGQGNAGGSSGGGGAPYPSGGGGGAGAVGGNAIGNTSGAGGIGTTSAITGTTVYYAGGGGGCGNSGDGNLPGAGGTGGGGTGDGYGTGSAGTANTGGGGGGGFSGGSGVVIISVPTSYYSGITTGSPTVTTSGSNTILKFTSSGSYTA